MHVNVLACGIFGTVSGSSAATCATIAKVALPELIKRGYDEKTALGSLCGAGTLGILLPPSIIMVVYAVAAEVSILKVFLAGFLPGLPADGAVLRLHHRLGAAQPGQDAEGPRSGCRFGEKLYTQPPPDSLHAADRVHRLGDDRSAGPPPPSRPPTACWARSPSPGGRAA